MHTILGAGGAIGTELARALGRSQTPLRLVGRAPRAIHATDDLHPADLTQADAVDAAVAGSEVCYLTVGYPYEADVWEAAWPVTMRAVLDACARHGARLVFFDNVYGIDPAHVGHITESSPLAPTSRKGKVRAAVDRLLLDAVEKGRVTALIARAPDFFGPVKERSLLMNLLYDNLAQGKRPQWFCNADVPHSSGYAPALAEATARLGTTPDAFGQIWNLPTDPEAPTGRQWAALFADAMGRAEAPAVQVLPGWMMRVLGLGVPILREMYEMRYQFDRPYVFDASKYAARFGEAPVSNAEAVQRTVGLLTPVQ